MATDNQDLKLTITAIDEASAVLDKVKKELAGVTGAQDKAGKSSESMAKSVFKGAAAYDILRKSVGMATAFIGSSINESLEASRMMQQVETNVRNAGFSYEQLSPKIEEYGKAAVQLGFDDEVAAQSISKLLLVTKDYDKARALANLSMDLARNKNISLEDATKAITMVTQGNTKALKEYGIELGDTATTADVLRAAQDKVKDSAKDFAGTATGQVETFRQEWANVKQEIGDQVMPALIELMATFQKYMPQIQALVGGVVTVVSKLAQGMLTVIKAAEEYGSVLGGGLTTEEISATDAIEAKNAQLNAMAVAYNKLHPGQKIFETDLENNNALLKEAAKAYNQLNKVVKPIDPFSGISNKGGGGTGGAVAKYEELGKALTAVRQKAVDELAGLKDAHTKNVTSAKEKILSLTKSLSDLSREYQKTAAEAAKAFQDEKSADRLDIATKLVDQRKKLNELQNSADTETDPNKKIGLDEQLAKERTAYEKTADLRLQLSNEIVAVEARNSMTDLERAVADYTSKRARAEQEYAENRADAQREYEAKAAEIKAERKQTQQKLDEENSTYRQKRKEINAIIAQAEAERLVVTKNTADAVVKEVDRQIQKYNQLADSIARVSGGKPPSINSSKVSSAGLQTHEHGGTVIGPRGVAVPIIAHGGETIIPAGKQENGSPVIINLSMNYPQFKSREDMNVVKDQINNALRDVIRIHKLQTS